MTNDEFAHVDHSTFVIREFVICEVPRMDFLNKSINQIGELFRSMTPGARVTAGLLLAVVIVSMGYLFQHGASGPDAYLFGGEPLSDGHLTRVEAAIAKAGLSDYHREGNRIRVPAGQQAKYLAAVADEGALPPNFNTILENALDKGGPWESREATRERLKVARQQTLSEIVRAMYWVESAIVLYDEQESRDLRQFGTTKQMTASVSVKPIVGETLTPYRAKNIQKLVAHAVNMKATDVAVTNLGEGGAAGGDAEINWEIFDDELLKTKVAFEAQKRESIMGALRDIPGVRVEVNADFNDTIEESTRTAKPDPKAVAKRETTRDDVASQPLADGGGRPGSTAQGPNRQQPTAATPVEQAKTESHSTENDFVVGVEESRVLKKGRSPKEVWATVTIPSSYVKGLWTGRNPTATTPPKPEDLSTIWDDVRSKVENLVNQLLILQVNKGENQYPHVRVVMLDTLPAPAIESPSIVDNAMSWAGSNWNTVAMLGVAMFSLLVLRSVVNGKQGDPTGAAAAAPSAPLTVQTEEPKASASAGEPATEDNRPRLRLRKGNTVKDDLVEIVREDPGAAADILRSWIAKAS
jgi:flagellar M-ring protein FliF